MTTENGEAARPLEPQLRAIIIGASSGIGAALAERLASAGYRLAIVARRQDLLAALCDSLNSQESDNPRVKAYPHDVRDIQEIPRLFQTMVRDLGGLDLIAYVAGVQAPVALDEYDTEKDAAMIETNLLGAIAWLNQAADRFQRAGAGHIVGVSSIAGDRGRVASPVYNASKAGLNSYLEALRNRLTRHGVTVTTIKPGFVDTVNLKNATKTFWVISPAAAAEAIYRAVRMRRQTVYIPARWGLLGLVIKHIPSFIFRRLSF